MQFDLAKKGIIFGLGIEWHENGASSSARKRNSMWPTRVGHRSRTAENTPLSFFSFFFFHFTETYPARRLKTHLMKRTREAHRLERRGGARGQRAKRKGGRASRR